MHTPVFLIVQLFNCSSVRLYYYSSFTFSLFLYQAFQRPEQFVGHVSGILGNAESQAYLLKEIVTTSHLPPICFVFLFFFIIFAPKTLNTRNQIILTMRKTMIRLL